MHAGAATPGAVVVPRGYGSKLELVNLTCRAARSSESVTRPQAFLLSTGPKRKLTSGRARGWGAAGPGTAICWPLVHQAASGPLLECSGAAGGEHHVLAVTPSGMTRGGTRGFAAAGECRGLGVWCPAPGGALLPSRANRAQAAASPAESAGLSTRMASRTMRRGPGPECLTGLARPHPCVHQVNTVRYQAVASGHH